MRSIVIAGILALGMPMFGQIIAGGQVDSHQFVTQFVTQITEEDRGELDVADSLIKDYQEAIDSMQTDLTEVKELRQERVEEILREHGIKDTTGMTINGLYILYNPYQYNNLIWNGVGNNGVFLTSPSTVVPFGTVTY